MTSNDPNPCSSSGNVLQGFPREGILHAMSVFFNSITRRLDLDNFCFCVSTRWQLSDLRCRILSPLLTDGGNNRLVAQLLNVELSYLLQLNDSLEPGKIEFLE